MFKQQSAKISFNNIFLYEVGDSSKTGKLTECTSDKWNVK